LMLGPLAISGTSDLLKAKRQSRGTALWRRVYRNEEVLRRH
jgi:hypothetical protein